MSDTKKQEEPRQTVDVTAENERLKQRIAEMEARFLSADERERKRLQEMEEQTRKEREELLGRAENWEKRYRRTYLENALTQGATGAAMRLGGGVKDMAALKSLLLSEDFPAASCRLRRVSDVAEGERMEAYIEVKEQDESGKTVSREYDLARGMEKVIQLCPWLVEQGTRRGAGISATPPPTEDISLRINKLKREARKNPANQAARLELIRLLALKNKNQGGW